MGTRLTSNIEIAPSHRIGRLSAAEAKEARRLAEGPAISYMDSPLFREPDAAKRILEDAPDLPTPNCDWYCPGIDREWDADQQVPANTLLNGAQEKAIFLQFNYARFRAAQLQPVLLEKWNDRDAQQFLFWNGEAKRLRDRIIEFNLALVLAMARHVAAAKLDFTEMLSEGNMALMRAVDKFDVGRNFKFSTYACRAILKCFSRMSVKGARRRATFPASFDEAMEQPSVDLTSDRREISEFTAQLRQVMQTNSAALTELEQQVIRQRFPMEDDRTAEPPTLNEIGRMVGYSKERVRQIQNQALAKIRQSLEQRVGMPFE